MSSNYEISLEAEIQREIRRKSKGFQVWFQANLQDCLDHLERVYNQFVPELKTEEDCSSQQENRFKVWITDALRITAAQNRSETELEDDISKTDEIRRQLSETFRLEIEALKGEIENLKHQNMQTHLSTQTTLTDIHREAAQTELYYVNLANELKLEVERTKQEGMNQIQQTHEQHQQEISVFLKQYTTSSSSTKGQHAQIAYTQLISETFPSAELEETNNSPRTCDLRLGLEAINQPILIEIKNYTSTVTYFESSTYETNH